MPASQATEYVVALQSRVDEVARALFVAPNWTGPVPFVRVDPRVGGGNRALASTHHGVGLIRVSTAVAAEPAEFLRGTLAHEAGHVALGHHRASHAGWVLTVGIPLWALAIGCGVAGVQDSTLTQTSLWFGLAFLSAVLALRVIVIPSRGSELTADQWSTRLVGVETVLHTLQHLYDQESPLGRLATIIGMDTHPSPGQRARYVCQRAEELLPGR